MVALSKRMSKRRCRSCPGRDGCLHVRIYDEKKNPPEKKEEDVEQKEGEKAVVEREKEEDEEENKTKLNLLFKQVFNYPPTEEDKVTNNRINTTQDLFPNGRMIPKGHPFSSSHFSSRRDLSCLATRNEEILGGFIAKSRDQN